MKYRIWMLPGQWQEVEGEPFNYPGYESLGLFMAHYNSRYSVSEPKTGFAMFNYTLTPEGTRATFEMLVADGKITPEKIIACRDKELERRDSKQVTLTIPMKVLEILIRRSNNDVEDYLVKRITYDTMRKHK